MWIAYCLLFKAADAQHPIMRTMGVCLDWRSLSVLRLSDKRAIDAVAHVCSYLRLRVVPARPLFHLRQPAATFEFALDFGKNDDTLQTIWTQCKQSADRRVSEHLEKVAGKRLQQSALKLEISALEDKLRIQKAELDSIVQYNRHGHVCAEHNKQSRVVSVTTQQLSSSRERKINVEKMPPCVIQPLPSDQNRALRILFFLHMPEHLRVLSRISVMAQQMLLPRSFVHFTVGKLLCGSFVWYIVLCLRFAVLRCTVLR